ncbi:hypothetical protein [Aquipuribacter sp. SD81]|uniref:hypothetical protein n=1 Tax=Aquipuribacter sp. SD81 TaxID=3127703 RepID=UPI003018CE6B
MPRQLRLEGPALAPLLEQARREHGADVQVVSAQRVRTGGLAGFFAREHYEVTVSVPDAPAVSSPTPRPAGPGTTGGGLDALLAAADGADGASAPAVTPVPTVPAVPTAPTVPQAPVTAVATAPEATPLPVEVRPPGRRLSTETRAFDDVLAALRADLLGGAAAAEPEVVPAALALADATAGSTARAWTPSTLAPAEPSSVDAALAGATTGAPAAAPVVARADTPRPASVPLAPFAEPSSPAGDVVSRADAPRGSGAAVPPPRDGVPGGGGRHSSGPAEPPELAEPAAEPAEPAEPAPAPEPAQPHPVASVYPQWGHTEPEHTDPAPIPPPAAPEAPELVVRLEPSALPRGPRTRAAASAGADRADGPAPDRVTRLTGEGDLVSLALAVGASRRLAALAAADVADTGCARSDLRLPLLAASLGGRLAAATVPLHAGPGEVVLVVGPAPHVEATAAAVAEALGRARVVTWDDRSTRRRLPRLREQALAAAAPLVLAVPDADTVVVDLVEPDLVVGVVDATVSARPASREPVGPSTRVRPDVVAVVGAARAVVPAADLGAPVSLLDGRPATEGAWTGALLDALRWAAGE